MMWMIQWWRSPVSPSGSERRPPPTVASAWAIASAGPGAGRLPTRCVPRIPGNLHAAVRMPVAVLATRPAMAVAPLDHELRRDDRRGRRRSELERLIDARHPVQGRAEECDPGGERGEE